MDNLTYEQRREQVPGLAKPIYREDPAYTDMLLDREAENTGFFNATGRGFQSGDNSAYQVYKRVKRDFNAPDPVPGYNPAVDLERHKNAIPGEHQQSFLHARSPEEFQMILTDMQEQLHDQDILQRRSAQYPVSTFVARGLAGLVDLDLPLAVFSGGLSKGVTTGSRLARGALTGGASMAALVAAGEGASTTGDWSVIPAAGLMGMGFGAFGASMARKPVETAANRAIHQTDTEFAEFVADGMPTAQRDIRETVEPANDFYGSVRAEQEALAAEEAAQASAERGAQSFNMDDIEIVPDSDHLAAGQRASVGASQLNPQGSIADIRSPRSQQMAQDAQTWAAQTKIVDDYFYDNGNLSYKGQAGDASAKYARRFHDTVTRLGIGTDFDKVMKSGSVIGQKLAYDLLESASGLVRNNTSGAMYQDWYNKRLAGEFMPDYDANYREYAASKGVRRSEEVRQEFNRAVAAELNARAYDAPGTPRHVDPAVRGAADAHDRWSALEVEILKGRAGEHAVHGAENLKAYSGYMQQKWAGQNFSRMIQSGKHSQKQIIDAITEAYMHMHGVGRADAKTWANALFTRVMQNDAGADLNLIGILREDGRGFLEETLRNSGVSAKEIDKLIDRLTGAVADRGRSGNLKGRMDIDLRFVASNGIRIMDLVDTDIANAVTRRSRGSAGAAALARKGIRSRADRNEIIQAILDEQQAKGQSQATGSAVTDFLDADKHLTRQDLEDLFTYFDAGPVAGGVNPVVSRVKKLTNLALMNQLGLTQMAETGAQIASVGWTRWMKHAGEAFNAALKNPDSPLAKELKHMSIMVPEDRLFRYDYAMDMDRVGSVASERMRKFDHALNVGGHFQGYWSGYFPVRNFQQRVAVSAMADKIMTNMKGLAKDLSPDRAADIGINQKTWAKIKKYVDNGTVEFQDGSLYKLNLDKWSPDDAEQFAFALNRHQNQVVQKAMIGESNTWFHKDGIASLFFHLKSFPLLAMHKQMHRNARIADSESMNAFMFGLATAGAAWSVRQAVNGRSEQLEPSKIVKGAIGLSNMTGWFPMWSDPIANMLGMDSLKFNAYAGGVTENVISTPAALPTLNRMANIPGAVINTVTGDMSNSDIRALQATPLIGTAYGFSALFNAMK